VFIYSILKMPWIENVAADDIPKAWHHDAGPNSMLIQIMDTCPSWWPEPKFKFKEIHRFEFLDLEKEDFALEPEMKISDEQAHEIVRLLKHALDNKMNVVVHCVAGVCRSGAVTEVGVMMGFQDTEKFRSPNRLVKHKMLKALGWEYDPDEPYTVNGVPFEYDELNNKIWLHMKEEGNKS
jgi:hypothetical protein